MQTKITPSRLDTNKDYTSLIPYTASIANTGAQFANSAFVAANSGAVFANASFARANASYTSQNTTAVFANAAFTAANTAISQSNISPFLLMGS